MWNRVFHSQDLRRYRSRESGGISFVTKCLEPGKAALDKEERQLIVSSLEFSVEQNRIEVAAYVVLPDYFHVAALARFQ
jgi:hypothetical protein